MELTVGQKARREMTVTSEMVAAYVEVAGDYNPLPFDNGFVSRTRFKGLIAQGGITTGLLHALIAMVMPGPGTVFVEQQWRFPKPVYVGDEIRAEATVTWVHESKPMATLDFEITNQQGEQILTGSAETYQALPTPMQS